MIAGDVASAQAEEPIIVPGAKVIPVEASTEKTLVVEPILEVLHRKSLQFQILKFPW